MHYKDIIIILLLLILFYYNFYYFKKIIKCVKSYIYPIKHFDIKSDLVLVKKEQQNIINYIKKTLKKDIPYTKLQNIIIYVIEDGKKIRPVIISSIYKQLNNLNEKIENN